ncbi:hypothetical protein TWF281_006706 [Arthrobotrys megalospora]
MAYGRRQYRDWVSGEFDAQGNLTSRVHVRCLDPEMIFYDRATRDYDESGNQTYYRHEMSGTSPDASCYSSWEPQTGMINYDLRIHRRPESGAFQMSVRWDGQSSNSDGYESSEEEETYEYFELCSPEPRQPSSHFSPGGRNAAHRSSRQPPRFHSNSWQPPVWDGCGMGFSDRFFGMGSAPSWFRDRFNARATGPTSRPRWPVPPTDSYRNPPVNRPTNAASNAAPNAVSNAVSYWRPPAAAAPPPYQSNYNLDDDPWFSYRNLD